MSTQIQGRYFGEAKPLFILYMKTAILTVLTLGIYRFWAKTRLRKFVWSATSLEEDSFEYTGTGLEKFLGFLVAVVILAIYLGIVQMLLFFVGLQFTIEADTPQEQLTQLAVIYITLFAVLPLLLFAQYRARRYKMARTRWRGIRLGMDNGAWGYALRALGYYFLVMITLGILTPLATYRLEKYMADRTWYGDAKVEQGGRWQDLFPGMKHILYGLLVLIVPSIIGGVAQIYALIIIGTLVGYVWMLIGGVYYRIYAFNYLTRHKTLDGEVSFDSEASTGRVVTIAVVGTIVMGVVGAVVFGVLALIGAAAFSGMTETGQLPGGGIVSLIIAGLLYVLAFLIIGGLNLVMIVQPVVEHVISNVTVHNAEHLATIQQRSADLGADAEGFADALDVGGAL
jgi:uncharacterized membrane protein YjgN (DUF898 family)